MRDSHASGVHHDGHEVKAPIAFHFCDWDAASVIA